MNYLVGDIQGCADALDRLLAEIGFSPSRDRLYVLGDLVNRGRDSLGVLRRLRDLGDAAHCVLGNHDWHLLAVAAGVRPRASQRHPRRHPRRARPRGLARLAAPSADGGARARLADAACRRRAAVGPGARRCSSPPTWSGAARPPPREFLGAMFGNEPRRWSESLSGVERLRFTLNA